jgi:hypothetical protein
MAIYRLLKEAAFDPEAVKAMATAYEEVLQELKLTDRSDGLNETVARKIIEYAKAGERDPSRLRDVVLKSLAG